MSGGACRRSPYGSRRIRRFPGPTRPCSGPNRTPGSDHGPCRTRPRSRRTETRLSPIGWCCETPRREWGSVAGAGRRSSGLPPLGPTEDGVASTKFRGPCRAVPTKRGPPTHGPDSRRAAQAARTLTADALFHHALPFFRRHFGRRCRPPRHALSASESQSRRRPNRSTLVNSSETRTTGRARPVRRSAPCPLGGSRAARTSGRHRRRPPTGTPSPRRAPPHRPPAPR